MEVKKFYHKKLYLRFCVSPRYASDVTKLVIYCLSNWFSFSFSHHGVHKKGNLFQTFLFLIKKTPFLNFPLSYKKDPHTMKKIENRNVSFPVAFFLNLHLQQIQKHEFSSSPQIWQPLLLPEWMTLPFFLGEEINSSIVNRSSCHCNYTWRCITFTFRFNNRMIFMGFPILPSWLNSYDHFAPGFNFNLFCLKLII